MSPTRNIKQYKPRESNVEAIKVTPETAQEAAWWGNGQVTEEGILVPTLEGNLDVRFDEYLVRDIEKRRFFCLDEESINNRYVPKGVRGAPAQLEN